jgi:hypothetical protein
MPSDNIPTTVGKVATKVIDSLPSAYTMVIFSNLILVGGMLWFESRQSEQRLEILKMAFYACPSAVIKGEPHP